MADKATKAAEAPSWRTLITNDILDKPDVPPFDKKRGREKLAKVVEAAAAQISGNKTKAPNRIWHTRYDGSIVISLKLNGHPIAVADDNGQEREDFAIPEGQGDAVLKGLADFIRSSDEFDAQIEAALTGETAGDSASKPATTRTRLDRKGLGNKAKPDDAEWMATFVQVYGEAPADMENPVPNSMGTRWVSGKYAARGKAAQAARNKA